MYPPLRTQLRTLEAKKRRISHVSACMCLHSRVHMQAHGGMGVCVRACVQAGRQAGRQARMLPKRRRHVWLHEARCAHRCVALHVSTIPRGPPCSAARAPGPRPSTPSRFWQKQARPSRAARGCVRSNRPSWSGPAAPRLRSIHLYVQRQIRSHVHPRPRMCVRICRCI